MAGFEVTLYGRIWVTTKDFHHLSVAIHYGPGVSTQA